jgi:hypothetical protein
MSATQSALATGSTGGASPSSIPSRRTCSRRHDEPARLAGSRTTFAAAVSANGTAVAGMSGSREHAVIWTLGQNSRGYPVWSVRDLGSPPVTQRAPPWAAAWGINPVGTGVVGTA